MSSEASTSANDHGQSLQPTADNHPVEDRNEDYCAVCRNGGDLLCCDRCPRVFHLPCHVPIITSFPSPNVQWLCTLCSSTDSSLRLEAPEPRPVTGTKRRSGACGLTDREQQVCERLLLELYSHELSLPFHNPVSKSIPNYYKMITRPMDLGKIRSKLNRTHVNHYQMVEDFVSDIQLVFANCATFNPPETEIGKAGVALHAFFISRLVALLPYVDIRASTPISEQSDWPTVRGTKRRRIDGKSSLKGSSHGSIDDSDALSSPDLQPDDNNSRTSMGCGGESSASGL